MLIGCEKLGGGHEAVAEAVSTYKRVEVPVTATSGTKNRLDTGSALLKEEQLIAVIASATRRRWTIVVYHRHSTPSTFSHCY